MELPRPCVVGVTLFGSYPRFKRIGVRDLFFRLVSAQAAHLRCEPTSFEWSKIGLPYPKLHRFVQSLLDTRDHGALTDTVDGMDLSEDWGFENLDLTYTDDDHWARWANERILRVDPTATLKLISTDGFDRKAVWRRIVEGKQRRGGLKYPAEVYATRFRLHGSQDPRTRDRKYV